MNWRPLRQRIPEILRDMRRLLILAFALLLPFQFAWAGASAYCQHETDPAQTKHFGHHSHLHQAAEKSAGTKSFDHADCGVCHAAGAGVMSSATTDFDFDSRAFSSPDFASGAQPSERSRPPERPQWLRLA